ncbi:MULTISPECIES: MarR family winged helix-turn-helix transcriptional regulator [Actinoalloteichus]|uniref:Winged helix DNA-binding domain n=1 Tax=Actinoalloteichus fjordicus TaxID=1612552 RepID=A0AAC9LBT8_9PSEU|nr:MULTISPECIES: MarR family winged helix-turn-helix transcriptional regulator [Actinoalloteichus]APU13817.1 Winged helix DNA-binding domain [Actinoalloteichus fjordicus]APU19763.1 Winged helix DNA-binding domain [Actinoalloteichus sp. GBA129-24]
MDEARTPIGFWLKHLDQLIEAGLDDALATANVTRRQWQVLSTLRARPRETAELLVELRPFATVVEAHDLLDDLTDRGWIADEADRWTITADGVAVWSAAAEHAHEFRRVSSSGVTEEDYRTTLRVLRRMAGNIAGRDVSSS